MKILSSQSTLFGGGAFLGVVLLLALALGLCGFFGFSNDIGTGGAGCGTITFLGNSMHARDLLFGGIILLLIAGLLFQALNAQLELRKRRELLLPLFLVAIRSSSFLSKLYDLILLALRRGILHSQVYNLLPITY